MLAPWGLFLAHLALLRMLCALFPRAGAIVRASTVVRAGAMICAN